MRRLLVEVYHHGCSRYYHIYRVLRGYAPRRRHPSDRGVPGGGAGGVPNAPPSIASTSSYARFSSGARAVTVRAPRSSRRVGGGPHAGDGGSSPRATRVGVVPPSGAGDVSQSASSPTSPPSRPRSNASSSSPGLANRAPRPRPSLAPSLEAVVHAVSHASSPPRPGPPVSRSSGHACAGRARRARALGLAGALPGASARSSSPRDDVCFENHPWKRAPPRAPERGAGRRRPRASFFPDTPPNSSARHAPETPSPLPLMAKHARVTAPRVNATAPRKSSGTITGKASSATPPIAPGGVVPPSWASFSVASVSRHEFSVVVLFRSRRFSDR